MKNFFSLLLVFLFVSSGFNSISSENTIEEINIRYQQSDTEENSILCGYIENIETNEKISDVQVSIYWEDYFLDGWNNTYSDINGYYQMNVSEGDFEVYFDKTGFYDEDIDDIYVNDSSIKWINQSLYPEKEETASVSGYIRNSLTDEPIFDASISVSWEDDCDNYKDNNTYSDINGYYEINVAPGTIDFYVYESGFFRYYGDEFSISDYEHVILNISLDPEPLETAIISGYIQNSLTDEAIPYAQLYVCWEDDNDHYEYNNTYSDINGYYEINVAPGTIDFYVYESGFFSYHGNEFSISDYEQVILNISLEPKPIENGIIKGFIKNIKTNESIRYAQVDIHWRGGEHGYSNSTYSDENGYYEINVASGTVYLNVEKTGFFNYRGDKFSTSDSEIVTQNIFMEPKPQENVLVKGYIRNSETNESINDAFVDLDWKDEFGHYDSNHTYTDIDGYFEINVAAGVISIEARVDNYYSKNTGEIISFDNEIIFVNFSLNPHESETVLVNGYVLNGKNDKPIAYAEISLYWSDYSNHYDYNYTVTDENGYYEIFVRPGWIELDVSINGFFYESTNKILVNNGEQLTMDFTLDPKPVENILIKGYVKDKKTNEPIQDARIYLSWDGFSGHYYSNYTRTDSMGYYEIKAALGSFYVSASANGFFSEYSDDYTPLIKRSIDIDFYLTQQPEENSIIKGIVKDKKTGNPLSFVWINMFWEDEYGYCSNYTNTDSNGFYSFKVASRSIELDFDKSGYLHEEIEITIEDNSINQIDIDLIKEPDETSIISGFITSKKNGSPLSHTQVSILWKDDDDHKYHNNTYADQDGFYEINVAPGTVDLYFYKDGYWGGSKNNIVMNSNSTYWYNASLRNTWLKVDINPKNGIYSNGRKIFPLLFRTIIFGNITLEADCSAGPEKVEFYIDGQLKKTDYSYPYTCIWDDKSLFLHKHIIKVKAYYQDETVKVKRTMMTKFF